MAMGMQVTVHLPKCLLVILGLSKHILFVCAPKKTMSNLFLSWFPNYINRCKSYDIEAM